MKKIGFLFLGVILLLSCKEKQQKHADISIPIQKTESKNTGNNDKSVLNYGHSEEPYYWTLEKQKAEYIKLIKNGDMDKILEFRSFIESLAKYHHGDAVHEFNPVILMFDEYPGFIEDIYKARPDLFLHGHINNGEYIESPIVHLIKEDNLTGVKYYFEKQINYNSVDKRILYGGIHTDSLLTFAVSNEMVEFLTSKGLAEKLVSETQTIEFGFNYDNYYTSEKMNLIPSEENLGYKQFNEMISRFIDTNGSYEHLFKSNIFIDEEDLFIPNAVNLNNKIVRVSKEVIELQGKWKSWNDTDCDTRIITTEYYVFDGDGCNTDKYYIYDVLDDTDIRQFIHYKYEFGSNCIKVMIEDFLEHTTNTKIYTLSQNEDYIELENKNDQYVIRKYIHKNYEKDILSYSPKSMYYFETSFTNDSKFEISRIKYPDSDNIIIKNETTWRKGIKVDDKIYDSFGNLTAHIQTIERDGNLIQIEEKINSGIITMTNESEVYCVYDENGILSEIKISPIPYLSDGRYSYTNITILDEPDSYFTRKLMDVK